MAFGKDSIANGNYSYANGLATQANSDYSMVMSGKNNIVNGSSNYSGVVFGESNVITGKYSVILGGINNKIFGDYSVAFGQNAEIGESISKKANNVFMFAPSGDAFKTTTSNQFLVNVKNGFGLGTTNPKQSIVLGGTSYTPSDNSFRTAGDVISIKPNGEFGYIIADGRYLTNLKSLWESNDSNDSVFQNNHQIGIGTNDPHDNVLLHLKETGPADNYKAHIRLESSTGSTLDIKVDGNHSFITANGTLTVGSDTQNIHFNVGGGAAIHIQSNKDVMFKDDIEVQGVSSMNGQIKAMAITVNGTVSANVFVGDGKGLRNINVYALNADDKDPTQQVYVKANGFVGVGEVGSNGSNIHQMFHVISSSTSTAQVRLSALTKPQYYTTFESGNIFTIKHHLENKAGDADKVFQLMSKKNTSATAHITVLHNGKVGIGVEPTGSEAAKLIVNGSVTANNFIGNGSGLYNISGVAIDDNAIGARHLKEKSISGDHIRTTADVQVKYVSATTMNMQVLEVVTANISQALQLTAVSSAPSCVKGLLYVKNNSSEVGVLCYCSDNSTRRHIAGGGGDTDCN